MDPNLQISHLRTLIAIAETGSFEAAGERIGRTQSAVTQQMNLLEKIAGTELFRSRGRRRELTQEGMTFVRYGKAIMSLCNQAVTAIGREHQRGVVTIGAPQEIAEQLLPDVLCKFSGFWPNVKVIIHVERSPKLMEMAERHLLDLTLTTRRSGLFIGQQILKLPVFWLAAQEWQHEPEKPFPLLLPNAPSLYRNIALSAFDISGLPYAERVTSPSLSGIRLAVAAGLGLTARTSSGFFQDIKVLDENDGLPPLPDVPFYLYKIATEDNQPASDLFDLILDHASVDGLAAPKGF